VPLQLRAALDVKIIFGASEIIRCERELKATKCTRLASVGRLKVLPLTPPDSLELRILLLAHAAPLGQIEIVSLNRSRSSDATASVSHAIEEAERARQAMCAQLNVTTSSKKISHA
jgi:hypothetical protein